MSAVSAIIVAAGGGKRFGGPKQFASLGGRPILERVLERFESSRDVDAIVLVLPPGQHGETYRSRFGKLTAVVEGGARRQDSAWRGFRCLNRETTELVLVHDGARPLVDDGLIRRVVERTRKEGAAVPVIPLEDTIKEIREGLVGRTLDRSRLFRIQTPQGFLYPLLEKAFEKARQERPFVTDEAMLLELAGIPVSVVEGDPRNIKITTPRDIKIAEVLCDE